MEKEIWKDIPNYEGQYQVSTLGRIRKNNIIVKQYKDNDGYMCIMDIFTTVHTLVTLAFIGAKPSNMHICHSNGIRHDNRVENLRYDTISENSIDVYRYGGKNSQGKLSIEDVLKIRRFYKEGTYNQVELAKIYNVNKSSIHRIVNKINFSWLNDDGSIKESSTEIKYKP